jgi:hypothetical protein
LISAELDPLRALRPLLLIELGPLWAAPETMGAGVLEIESGARREKVADALLLARLGEFWVQPEARPGLAEPRAGQAVEEPLQVGALPPLLAGLAYAIDAVKSPRKSHLQRGPLE